jgi:hypothetical protein
VNIGVFGDSYAEKKSSNKIWYHLLQDKHGHTVQSFGEGGSSINFSARLIDQLATNYDLTIWCVTTPGRFSFQVDNCQHHVITAQDKYYNNNIEIEKKHQACVNYLKYVFDWEEENFVGRSVVSYITTKHNNIMLIPCFPPPLDAKFNLYTLCENEARYYFPGKTIPEIYQKYQDLRPGHISFENQEILAQIINDNLHPGMFQTDYNNFIKPLLPLEKVFIPL